MMENMASHTLAMILQFFAMILQPFAIILQCFVVIAQCCVMTLQYIVMLLQACIMAPQLFTMALHISNTKNFLPKVEQFTKHSVMNLTGEHDLTSCLNFTHFLMLAAQCTFFDTVLDLPALPPDTPILNRRRQIAAHFGVEF